MTITALYPFALLNDPPAPTYSEYEAIVEQARRESPAFVDPSDLYPARAIANRRGADWCTAVLGRPHGPYERRSHLEEYILIVADRENIDPALPEWIEQARAEGQRVHEEREAAKHALRQRDAKAWEDTLAATTVPLEVRTGSRPRVRGGLLSDPLRHAVPTSDVVSGERRLRVHRAGSALCESERRSRALELGGVSDGPTTCVRCLAWAPKVRERRVGDA